MSSFLWLATRLESVDALYSINIDPARITALSHAVKATGVTVYAVDEGILQVANYDAPRPLDFFLPKMALQVGTTQMVDLILPTAGMINISPACN